MGISRTDQLLGVLIALIAGFEVKCFALRNGDSDTRG
jgi:hypothetical protein